MEETKRKSTLKKTNSVARIDELYQPQLNRTTGLKRQHTSGKIGIGPSLHNQSKHLSSSTSMDVFSPAHKSSQMNSLSTINIGTGNSLTLATSNQRGVKGKLKRSEEGFEGLPQECNPVDEKDFEEADSCFSCNKPLQKNLGVFSGKGRHHCRRCGRTVCEKCRRNDKRISQTDKKEYKVCDQCDFEISNYHLFDVLEQIKNLQQNMHNTLQDRNSQMEIEIKIYREQKKQLQEQLEQKQDEFEQVQSQMKSQLQKANLESERYQSQIQLLTERQKQEQEKRAELLSEKNALNLRENELKYKQEGLERDEKNWLAQQQQLLNMVGKHFPEEIQEEILRQFDRIRGLTASQIMDDSELMFLQESMNEPSQHF